jgi:hypothetical protein
MKTTRMHWKTSLQQKTESYCKQPTTEARESGEEKHSHHALTGENHLLARASHAPVHGVMANVDEGGR